jgi:hypothetical protein
MISNNSAENVFRFVQVRPPVAVAPDESVELEATALAKELAASDSRERMAIAAAYRREHMDDVRAIIEAKESAVVEGALARTLDANGTVADFRDAVHGSPEVGPSSESGSVAHALRRQCSDLLLAAKFAAAPNYRELRPIERLFRGFSAAISDYPPRILQLRLAVFLRRPIVLPDIFRESPKQTESRHPEAAGEAARSTAELRPGASRAEGRGVAEDKGTGEQLLATLQEIRALDQPGFLRLPEDDAPSASDAPYFALSDVGSSRLSAGSRSTLKDLGIDISVLPLSDAISRLELELGALAPVGTRPPHALTTPAPGPQSLPLVVGELRPAGVADLLIVKQHLKRYERADIAHVENVLIGEKRSRTHRELERTEETFVIERERTEEHQTELETAERFEMNRETSETAKHDQQFGFGLTLSGKYGPTVEFSSNAQADVSTSTEESVKSATTYAKDVMQRSLDRVVERVREEQIRRVIKETEETNLHEFDNGTGEHVTGVYQFLEKVYESQIFNYGIREMFDFMIPEPAFYLWYLEDSPDTDLNLPAPPPRLDAYAPNAASINPYNYLQLAALFGASEIDFPPPSYKSATVSLDHGESGNEEGQPRSAISKDVPVPAGYRPYRAQVRPLALTDNVLTVGVTIGNTQRVWRPQVTGVLVDVGSGNHLGWSALDMSLMADSYPYEDQSKLPLQVLAYETNAYALAAVVTFTLTTEAYRAWQIKTYDAIASAYADSVTKYEQKVAELKAVAQADAARTVAQFGAPPSQNLQTIKSELKKSCIALVTRQWYDSFGSVLDGDPPVFDFDLAAAQGSIIRFFEQAFEWDQLQYVFYPYYWGRHEMWAKRFKRQDIDPAFLEFLQAGEARVLVPVRPGFEEAITHYLETGEVWNGDGDPPPITSPLYVSIVTEIQERTDAPGDELPMGEPWETHVPTPLVIVRRESDLPKWLRQSADGWDWHEAPSGP